MHVAAAVGAPTVGIFALQSDEPDRWAPLRPAHRGRARDLSVSARPPQGDVSRLRLRARARSRSHPRRSRRFGRAVASSGTGRRVVMSAPNASGVLALRAVAAADPVVPALARLMVDAYPILGVTSSEALARTVARWKETFDDPGVRWVVAERDGALVGGMRLHDYVMNVRGLDLRAAGVGSVAVSLAHKRQGVARAMIAWYLDDARARGAAVAILHPFRPDFYRALGFGHGTPLYRYALRPSALRADAARGSARLLEESDLDAVLALSRRLHRRTNGAIERHAAPLQRALADVALRHVGIDEGGELRAYMQTAPLLGAKETQNRNRLSVRNILFEEPAHLAALLGYLRAQQDQFAEAVIESSDPALYLATDDPRDRSDRIVAPPAGHRVAEMGLGMQYRLVDLAAAFAHLPYAAEPFVLRVHVDDAFYAPTAGVTTFRFGPAGPPSRANAAEPDATLRIGIADLSALVVGSLRRRPAAPSARERRAAGGRGRRRTPVLHGSTADDRDAVLSSMRFTIQLCTYNRAHLLERVLEACFDQTVAADEYEVVLVNDGSPDDTPAVIERARPLATCRFTVVRPSQRRARARAQRRHRARDAASGSRSSTTTCCRRRSSSPNTCAADDAARRRRRARRRDQHASLRRAAGAGVDARRTTAPTISGRATSRCGARGSTAPAAASTSRSREYGWEDIELGMRLRALGHESGLQQARGRVPLQAARRSGTQRRGRCCAKCARKRARRCSSSACTRIWRVALAIGDTPPQRCSAARCAAAAVAPRLERASSARRDAERASSSAPRLARRAAARDATRTTTSCARTRAARDDACVHPALAHRSGRRSDPLDAGDRDDAALVSRRAHHAGVQPLQRGRRRALARRRRRWRRAGRREAGGVRRALRATSTSRSRWRRATLDMRIVARDARAAPDRLHVRARAT